MQQSLRSQKSRFNARPSAGAVPRYPKRIAWSSARKLHYTTCKHIVLIVTPQAILPSKRKRQDGTLSEGELGRLGYPRVRGMDRLGVILKHREVYRRSLPLEVDVIVELDVFQMPVCSSMQVSY